MKSVNTDPAAANKPISVSFDDYFMLRTGEKVLFLDHTIYIIDENYLTPKSLPKESSRTGISAQVRLGINIIFSLLVISAALYTGFYPIFLALFISLLDIRHINRNTHPISRSCCIPLDRVEEVRFHTGGLGLNRLDVIYKNQKGKTVLRPLLIYDNIKESDKAIRFFIHYGFLGEGEFSKIHGEKLSGESFAMSGNEACYVEKDSLKIARNGQFNPQSKDSAGLRNYMLILVTLLLVYAAYTKMKISMDQGALEAMDYAVMAFFLLLGLIPLKMMNRSTANQIRKDSIVDFKVKKGRFGKLKLWLWFKNESGQKLRRKITFFPTNKEANRALDLLKDGGFIS